MKIILASASPRRRELLTQMGLEFEVCPSGGEEVITKEIPSEVVMELATQKAGEVAARVLDGVKGMGYMDRQAHAAVGDGGEETLVIGADTIVVKDHQILGKPKDEADAVRMLSMLQGDVHQVYTGVCLILIANQPENDFCKAARQEISADIQGQENAIDNGIYMLADGAQSIQTFFEKTDVHFNPMTEQEIWDYVKTGDPLDKAGAYGIQGVCGKYIRGIEGDYHNVVGLPIARLYQEMKRLNIC